MFYYGGCSARRWSIIFRFAQIFIIKDFCVKDFQIFLITLSKEFSLARLQSSCFQESGEYVPLLYEMEYFRNISTKIETLQDLGEELASEKTEDVTSTSTDSSGSETK